MKIGDIQIRLTRKARLIIAAYLTACGLAVFFGDFVFAVNKPFLSNMITGLLTILGGFLLAYWLIDSYRISREVESKKRVVSTLKILRNFLLPWIYHYAIALSGHIELQDDDLANKIANRRFKNDINLLEYIFGRGNYPDPDEKISKHTFYLKTVRDSLDYGLRRLEEIERRIREFPSFVEEIDTKIAKIIHLSAFIRERITELKEWECRYGEDQDYEIELSRSNGAIRCNLKTVGRTALDVVTAIDANLEKLKE